MADLTITAANVDAGSGKIGQGVAGAAITAGKLIYVPRQRYPIERFWLHFKQLAVANRLHASLTDLQRTVHTVMTDQNTLNHPNRLSLLDKFRLVA